MRNQNKNSSTKTVQIALLTGLTLVLLMPFIITRQSFSGIVFNDSTGVIGDTIGGITAPIVGLIGAYLVYLGFKVQVDTNSKQFKALYDQQALAEQSSNYTQLKDLIDMSYFTLDELSIFDDEIEYKGKDMITFFASSKNRYRFANYIDQNKFANATILFSSQGYMIATYFSNQEKFKLSELGKAVIREELRHILSILHKIKILSNRMNEQSQFNLPSIEKNIENISEIIG